MRGQQVFKDTGGTHAAGIFNREGTLLALSEDIGRHNALDKAIGKILLAHKAVEAKILILSSRLSYEMVSKAARLSIEVLTGVSSATSLAINLARSAEMTIVSFHRGQKGNIYSCPERIVFEN
jgi:FdhD protein